MWCGALVYKRHTEVLALTVFLAVWFDAAALSLGELLSCPPTPKGFRAGDHVGQMPEALGHTKSLLTWRSLVPPFIILLSEARFSSQSAALDFLFLPRL